LPAGPEIARTGGHQYVKSGIPGTRFHWQFGSHIDPFFNLIISKRGIEDFPQAGSTFSVIATRGEAIHSAASGEMDCFAALAMPVRPSRK
jgi:hypothetical protein